MAASDWLSLAEAKEALDIPSTDTSQDVVLAVVVEAVSDRLDDLAGPAVRRTIVNEVHDGGLRSIELDFCPVLSVSSVVEHQTATSITLTQDQPGAYATDGWAMGRYEPQPGLLDGILHRRRNGQPWAFWNQGSTVVVNYTAGRFADTAGVAPKFKEAAKVTLKNWWRQYEVSAGRTGEFDTPASSFPRWAVPNAACLILQKEVQPEVGFGG